MDPRRSVKSEFIEFLFAPACARPCNMRTTCRHDTECGVSGPSSTNVCICTRLRCSIPSGICLPHEVSGGPPCRPMLPQRPNPTFSDPCFRGPSEMQTSARVAVIPSAMCQNPPACPTTGRSLQVCRTLSGNPSLCLYCAYLQACQSLARDNRLPSVQIKARSPQRTRFTSGKSDSGSSKPGMSVS
jgi:hypothetical protein